MSSDVRGLKQLKEKSYNILAVYNCTRAQFGTFLHGCGIGPIVESRQLGVSLKAGSSLASLSSHTCSMFLVMVESSDDYRLQSTSRVCNQVTNKQSPQYLLWRSSITLVTEHAPRTAFTSWPAELIYSLDDLCRLESIGRASLNAFTLAAQKLDTEVKDHISNRFLSADVNPCLGRLKGHGKGKCTGKFQSKAKGSAKASLKIPGRKDYERENNCSSETLRNLQRINLVLKFKSAGVPLGHSPCQLGFCDADHFTPDTDDCCIGDKNNKLPQMLKHMCGAGLTTWKIREYRDVIPPLYKPNQIIPNFLHTLKESVMQRVFRGAVILHGRAKVHQNVEETKSSGTSTTLFIEECVGVSPHAIAKHVCILLPLDILQQDDTFSCAAGAALGMDSAAEMFRADLIAQADFQIIRGWDGIGKSAIRLMRRSPLRGERVQFFICEYVGVEYNAISLLQKCRGRPSKALFQYVSTHCEHPSIWNAHSQAASPEGSFAFYGISCADVEKALVKQKIQLSHDQKEAIRQIAALRRHIIALRGPPGSAKTTLVLGLFKHIMSSLKFNQKLLWLTKTRKQRTKALHDFRTYLEDPQMVIGLGRSENDGSDNSQTDEFDPFIAECIENCVASIVDELKSLRLFLEGVDVGTQAGTTQDKEWREKSERMGYLNFQLYLAKREALECIFDNAKILCMTVDGFIQCASGEGMLSRYITPYEVFACGVDEAHQLEHAVVAAACARCDNVIFMWDEGQRIDFIRQSNKKSEGTILSEKSVYSWEKAVYGGSSSTIWETLNRSEFVNLKYTWRFGPAPALYLRQMDKYYMDDSVGCWSPQDESERIFFTPAELERVPHTVLRFVTYSHVKFYVCQERGEMKQDPLMPSTPDLANLTVAGAVSIFGNMFHEALCTIRGLQDKYLRLNADCEPIELNAYTEAIATMIYRNDVLINFDASIIGLLSDEQIKKAYGIELDFDPSLLWTCGTPESISGHTKLVGQVAHMPGRADKFNMSGNQSDPARRNVSFTRGRILQSMHTAFACFEQEKPPDAWQKHMAFLDYYKKNPDSRIVVQHVDVCETESDLAPISYKLCPDLKEDQAFAVLFKTIHNFPKFIRDVLAANPSLIRRYHRNPTEKVLDTMLSFTDGLLDEIVPGSSAEVPYENGYENSEHDEIDSDADHEDERDRMPVYDVSTQSLSEYRVSARAWKSSLAYLKDMLRKIPYVFSDSSGQVTPMIISLHPSAQFTEDIVHLQRLLMFLVCFTYSDALTGGADLTIALVPHKLRIEGRRVIRECHSDRLAQVVEVANGERLSYSYLGGGLEWDPPHAFGLVFRNMPLHLADRLLAVLHYVTSTAVDKAMFGVRPCADPLRKKTPAQKKEAVQNRVDAVNSHMSSLFSTSPRPCALFETCGIGDVSAFFETCDISGNFTTSGSPAALELTSVAQPQCCGTCLGACELDVERPNTAHASRYPMLVYPCSQCS